MIEAQESLQAVQANIETAINAVQNLNNAKQGLFSYTSYQESLMQEKKSLVQIVEDLRDEKIRLELKVKETKKNLHDLKIELKETHNTIINQTHTTKDPSTPAKGETERNITVVSPESRDMSAASHSSLDSCDLSLPERLIFENEDISFQCEDDDEHDVGDNTEEISTASAPYIVKKVPMSAQDFFCFVPRLKIEFQW